MIGLWLAYRAGRKREGRRRTREEEQLLDAMAERQRLRAPEPGPVPERSGGMTRFDWAVLLGAATVLVVAAALISWLILWAALGLVAAWFYSLIFGR